MCLARPNADVVSCHLEFICVVYSNGLLFEDKLTKLEFIMDEEVQTTSKALPFKVWSSSLYKSPFNNESSTSHEPKYLEAEH